MKNLVTVQLPETYTILSFPKDLTVISSDSTCIYNYKIEEHDGIITILSHFVRQRNEFAPDEFADLKQMYQYISDKKNEKIVLITKTE